jgi:hypothetical protein
MASLVNPKTRPLFPAQNWKMGHKHKERGYRAALLRFLTAISRVARGKGQLCHVLEIYIEIAIRGLDRIAPKMGIDKNFAQLEFYDPSQAKSRLEWTTRLRCCC